MMFTVKDFLELKEIEGQKIISIGKKTNEIVIDHVSVIEPPVENFVRKGELVLTTAIGCHNNAKVFLEFVKEICDLQAAALVISFEKDEIRIPEEVLIYAKQKEFPVIVIPWKYRYAEIIEIVLTKIRDIKANEQKNGEMLQKKLLNAYLDGKTLSEATVIIEKFIGKELIIVDTNYTIQSQTKKYSCGECLTQEQINEFEKIVEIKADNKYFGYVFFKITQETGVDKIKISQIDHYISLPLTLWFEKEQIISSTKLRIKDDFIWSLAKGDFKSSEIMYSQGRQLGFYLNKNYTCIVGKIGFLDIINMSDIEEEQWLDENISLIQDELIKVGKRLRKEIMVTFQKKMLIIYLENGEALEKDINLYIDIAENKLKNKIHGIGFAWGIGRLDKTQRIPFEKSYADAELAADLCYNEKGLGHRNTYIDSNIFRIISKFTNDSEVHELVKSTLSDLIDYDNAKQLNLIKIFLAYMNNNNNISETARKMYLHRQSLLYRLKKIEELTGISLSNHEDVFFLEICIRLLSIYPHKNA